jgi:beta-galactosidase
VAFYRPLRDQTQSVDVISPDATLDQYKLVVAPALNVLSQATADHLIAWVKQGGHLVLGPRSGMKDEYNALNPQRQPGPLVDFLGGNVSQFYALDTEVPVSGDIGTGTASIWAETISPTSPDTQVLLRYGPSNGWLDGQPAVITRSVGKGSITYIGAWLDPALLSKFTAHFVQQSGVQPILPGVPDGVEVAQRSREQNAGAVKSVIILINHTTANQHIALPQAMTDLLSANHAPANSVDLPKYGVAVLQK